MPETEKLVASDPERGNEGGIALLKCLKELLVLGYDNVFLINTMHRRAAEEEINNRGN